MKNKKLERLLDIVIQVGPTIGFLVAGVLGTAAVSRIWPEINTVIMLLPALVGVGLAGYTIYKDRQKTLPIVVWRPKEAKEQLDLPSKEGLVTVKPYELNNKPAAKEKVKAQPGKGQVPSNTEDILKEKAKKAHTTTTRRRGRRKSPVTTPKK